QAGVEEGELSQSLRQRLEVQLPVAEDLRIGFEADLGPCPVGLADHLERGLGNTAGVALAVDLPPAGDLQLQVFGKRVGAGDAHAVQTAGDLVGGVVEFPAGVQHGHHHLGGGSPLGGMDVGGDAPAVVRHGDRVVGVDHHVDAGAVARESLVHRVVHHLPDDVVHARLVRGADVHSGTLANRL